MNHERAEARPRHPGLGGFQLYDGTIQHKLMRLHQIRYGVNILPYDLAWNSSAVLVLIAAVIVLIRARREPVFPGRTAPGGERQGAPRDYA